MKFQKGDYVKYVGYGAYPESHPDYHIGHVVSLPGEEKTFMGKRTPYYYDRYKMERPNGTEWFAKEYFLAPATETNAQWPPKPTEQEIDTTL